jgi:hypothetical protein
MIDLAISVDDTPRGVTVVETNHGDRMTAPQWTQDSDFRLVAFRPKAKSCEVLWPEELASDIALALDVLEPLIAAAGKKPGWYHRLKTCAAGAQSAV